MRFATRPGSPAASERSPRQSGGGSPRPAAHHGPGACVWRAGASDASGACRQEQPVHGSWQEDDRRHRGRRTRLDRAARWPPMRWHRDPTAEPEGGDRRRRHEDDGGRLGRVWLSPWAGSSVRPRCPGPPETSATPPPRDRSGDPRARRLLAPEAWDRPRNRNPHLSRRAVFRATSSGAALERVA